MLSIWVYNDVSLCKLYVSWMEYSMCWVSEIAILSWSLLLYTSSFCTILLMFSWVWVQTSKQDINLHTQVCEESSMKLRAPSIRMNDDGSSVEERVDWDSSLLNPFTSDVLYSYQKRWYLLESTRVMILKVQRNVYIIYGVEEFSDQIIHMCMVQCGRSGGKECQESCANNFTSHFTTAYLWKESQHMMFEQCLSNEFVFGETNQDKLPIKR